MKSWWNNPGAPPMCCDDRLDMEKGVCAKIVTEPDDEGFEPDKSVFWLVNDDGRPVAAIHRCPWCGVVLADIPRTRRDTGST